MLSDLAGQEVRPWPAGGLIIDTRFFPRSAAAGLSGLRAWSSGCRSEEAAVELLAGMAVDGWAVDPARSWVQACHRPGWFWLDGDQLKAQLPALQLPGRPVAGLAALLLVGGTLLDLRELASRVPDQHVRLVHTALERALWAPVEGWAA